LVIRNGLLFFYLPSFLGCFFIFCLFPLPFRTLLQRANSPEPFRQLPSFPVPYPHKLALCFFSGFDWSCGIPHQYNFFSLRYSRFFVLSCPLHGSLSDGSPRMTTPQKEIIYYLPLGPCPASPRNTFLRSRSVVSSFETMWPSFLTRAGPFHVCECTQFLPPPPLPSTASLLISPFPPCPLCPPVSQPSAS